MSILDGMKVKVAMCFFFLGPPIISTPPKDASVLSGANVTFFCLGLGAPEPKMRWLKDSETVQSSKRVVIDTKIGSLRLFVVTVADAGKYTGVYKNRLGEDRRSAVLRVDGIDPGQCKFITGGAGIPSRLRYSSNGWDSTE